MARDWVKLHTSMLGHAGTMMLPPDAFRLWIVLLMMAGMTDDDGRAGTVDELAFNVRCDPSTARALLKTLNGRASVVDGVVYVRDWSEWQPKQDATNADRQARWKAKHLASGNGTSNAPVTTVTNAATRGRDSLIKNSPTQTEQPTTGTADAAPTSKGNGATPHAADWTPFYADVADHWTQTPNTKDGKLRAWVGQFAFMVGKFVGTDVSEARRLFRKWADSPESKYAQTPTLAPDKWGKWLQSTCRFDVGVQR